MSKIKKIGIMLVIALLIGVFTCQCGKKSEQMLDYNIEVILPLTGNLAFLGVPVKNALILAGEDWKEKLAKEKIRINLIFGDSQANPSTAVSIHRQNKVIKKINGLFSYLSGPTQALKPVAEAENILFVAFTVDPTICRNSKNLIRPYYDFGAEGKAILEIISGKNPNKIGIIYSTDPATAFEVERVVIPGLKQIEIDTIIKSYNVGNRDFKTHVLSMKTQTDSLPEILLTYGFGSDLPFLINTVREQDLFDKVMVIGPIGIADAILTKNSTKGLEGVHYFGPLFMFKEFELENPGYQTFKHKYTKKYKVEALMESTVYAYDTYSIIARTLLKIKSIDTETIVKEIKTSKIKGLAGLYDFDQSGNSTTPMGYASILENGDVHLIRSFNDNNQP
jgi:ABC-type branched-subunit amino acid transport system substrate-binding protein